MGAPTETSITKCYEAEHAMKIVLCHNYYQQAGGEDQVFADESDLLLAHGHKVIRYTVHNDAIHGMNRLSAAAKALWNRTSYREIETLLKRERPDVIHFTNTFPLISPSAYYAAKNVGIPVVQSLHNYRLLCPGGTFYRDGRVCEDCLSKIAPWPAIFHGCYRSSHLTTSVVSTMVTLHRVMKTWQNCVDHFIVLSHFSAEKFVLGGLPISKISVKPNFISPDPGGGDGSGNYAVFVGRLATEKGLATLLEAWDQVGSALPLKTLGDGPLSTLVEDHCRRNPYISWLGRRSGPEVLKCLSKATCLIMPSQWYECCPKTLIETLAVGTPAIVGNLGAMAEMIDHERTGLHFTPGNAIDLASQVHRLINDSQLRQAMRSAARQEYENKYTAASNYQQLIDIYCGVGAKPSTTVNSASTKVAAQEYAALLT
jgi:glycosyltransferase involved in cell wall biosynthesis